MGIVKRSKNRIKNIDANILKRMNIICLERVTMTGDLVNCSCEVMVIYWWKGKGEGVFIVLDVLEIEEL